MNRGLSLLADAMGESPMTKSRPSSMRFVMNHDGMFTSTTGRSMVDDEISRRGSISETSEHHAYAHRAGTPKSKNANGGMITCVYINACLIHWFDSNVSRVMSASTVIVQL